MTPEQTKQGPKPFDPDNLTERRARKENEREVRRWNVDQLSESVNVRVAARFNLYKGIPDVTESRALELACMNRAERRKVGLL